MTPPNSTLLQRAQAKLQSINATAAEKAAAITAKENAEAAELAQIEADARAVAQAEQDVVDAARAEVDRLQRQIEADRIAAVWAETLAHPGLATLWDRVDAAAARLAGAPHGAENLQVRSSIALERSTGIVTPAELWQVMSSQLAGLTIAGMTFHCHKATTDAMPGVGFFDTIKLMTATGPRVIHSAADLHRAVTENPSMRTAGQAPAVTA